MANREPVSRSPDDEARISTVEDVIDMRLVELRREWDAFAAEANLTPEQAELGWRQMRTVYGRGYDDRNKGLKIPGYPWANTLADPEILSLNKAAAEIHAMRLEQTEDNQT